MNVNGGRVFCNTFGNLFNNSIVKGEIGDNSFQVRNFIITVFKERVKLFIGTYNNGLFK